MALPLLRGVAELVVRRTLGISGIVRVLQRCLQFTSEELGPQAGIPAASREWCSQALGAIWKPCLSGTPAMSIPCLQV